MPRSLARHFVPLALLLALAAPACVVIDVDADHEAGGLKSTGLIGGYATAGWPSDDSLLKLGLLDGRNDGAIFLLQVWKLLRVEVGLLGLAVASPSERGERQDNERRRKDTMHRVSRSRNRIEVSARGLDDAEPDRGTPGEARKSAPCRADG